MRFFPAPRLACFLFALASCGGSDAAPLVSAAFPAVPGEARDGAAGGAGGAAAPSSRLQGTWEIVRYESASAVPPEAMPILSELFDALRLRFDGSDAVVQIGGAKPERRAFSATEEGDALRLSIPGGMFDGAVVRFVGDDEIDIDDPSETWAGVSRLRRVR